MTHFLLSNQPILGYHNGASLHFLASKDETITVLSMPGTGSLNTTASQWIQSFS